ncbi:IncP plasmid survival protein KfrC family protein [Xylella fastidiosa]|uniref:IncP plasmid survival protein KfrC family protein n=2 Tax=Xylella fastidiosa TaxID=2371 RepID=UPI00070822B6|nr:IncP plasmid survival protein KfrC family protein [Xylella fastidiosa]KQH73175.1 hypothetical protein AOT81_09995 [Xylella fastidiosa]WNY20299.1 IncP plasmid survival protein KfrC family protein [Xylella fastidiosa]WNY22588.1 IncP plasmid survival protein KfrC family protein [Xylella fastidiosa]
MGVFTKFKLPLIKDSNDSSHVTNAQFLADSMYKHAEQEKAEQHAMIETANLESEYSSLLAIQIQSKYDQVVRIEDQLEGLIEQQKSKLMQLDAQKPGLLTFPGKRASWQRGLQRQQALLQRLYTRLENVLEIKEGMGLHAPLIETLATQKLRAKEPELVEQWEDMKEAARHHQSIMRKKEQKRRQNTAVRVLEQERER